jgi:hypothetical protein
VQEEVLAKISDPALRVYVVWEPICKGDSRGAAEEAVREVPDRRATHYWAGDRELGDRVSPVIGLKGETAWDVYLLYPPNVKWEEKPPTPVFFMHQLQGRLPEELCLDATKLAERVRQLLVGDSQE